MLIQHRLDNLNIFMIEVESTRALVSKQVLLLERLLILHWLSLVDQINVEYLGDIFCKINGVKGVGYSKNLAEKRVIDCHMGNSTKLCPNFLQEEYSSGKVRHLIHA